MQLCGRIFKKMPPTPFCPRPAPKSLYKGEPLLPIFLMPSLMNVIRSGQKGPREIPTNKISSANLAPSDPTTSVAFSPASPVLPAGSPPLLPGSSCLPDGSWSPPLVDNQRAVGRGMIELERDADGHRRANICTHNICHSP